MNLFQAAPDLFVEHFGAEFFRRPARALDLRGFRMTRREAARWLGAIDPPGWDEPVSRADFAKVAAWLDTLERQGVKSEEVHFEQTDKGLNVRLVFGR